VTGSGNGEVERWLDLVMGRLSGGWICHLVLLMESKALYSQLTESPSNEEVNIKIHMCPY
jgi:hypothetical protein